MAETFSFSTVSFDGQKFTIPAIRAIFSSGLPSPRDLMIYDVVAEFPDEGVLNGALR